MKLKSIATGFATIAIGATLMSFAPPAEALVFAWDLGSHPDGGRATPYYGLRLDNVNSANDDFTWDFENSTMTMTYSNTAPGVNEQITISGNALGGRDAGSDWDVFANWAFNLVITGDDAIRLFSGGTGVEDGTLDGTDAPFDIFVKSTDANLSGTVSLIDGTISDPGTTNLLTSGDFFSLFFDGTVGGNFFHYDQNFERLNCPAHNANIAGVCDRTHEGAGWVNIDSSVLSGVEDGHKTGKHTRDFLFTGVANVPEPGMVGLLGLGLIGMGIARRRKAV